MAKLKLPPVPPAAPAAAAGLWPPPTRAPACPPVGGAEPEVAPVAAGPAGAASGILATRHRLDFGVVQVDQFHLGHVSLRFFRCAGPGAGPFAGPFLGRATDSGKPASGPSASCRGR